MRPDSDALSGPALPLAVRLDTPRPKCKSAATRVMSARKRANAVRAGENQASRKRLAGTRFDIFGLGHVYAPAAARRRYPDLFGPYALTPPRALETLAHFAKDISEFSVKLSLNFGIILHAAASLVPCCTPPCTPHTPFACQERRRAHTAQRRFPQRSCRACVAALSRVPARPLTHRTVRLYGHVSYGLVHRELPSCSIRIPPLT